MPRRLDAPPGNASDLTALSRWLRDLHRAIETIPTISLVSFGATETPNSRVSGFPGDIVVNVGSGSTDSRAWLMGGTVPSERTTLGWVLVRTVAP